MDLAPLKTLVQTRRGKLLPLPPTLARLYGCFRIPLPRARPYVFSNFVTTLDGVVSLNTKGHASGGDISGFSVQDRMVMGLLRDVIGHHFLELVLHRHFCDVRDEEQRKARRRCQQTDHQVENDDHAEVHGIVKKGARRPLFRSTPGQSRRYRVQKGRSPIADMMPCTT